MENLASPHEETRGESKTMKPDSESLGALDQFAIIPDLLDPFIEEPEFVDLYAINPDSLDQVAIIPNSMDPFVEAPEFIDGLEVVVDSLDGDEAKEEENAPKKQKKMSDGRDGLSPCVAKKTNDKVEGSSKIAPKVRVRDFNLNELLDAESDGEVDEEAEMKRFIKSLFQIFIPPLFY